MGSVIAQPAITGRTRLLGVLGWPVAHSLSPQLHNAALAQAGLDMVYVALPVAPADLPQVLSALPALGFGGVNLTLPHKEAALRWLDWVDPVAHLLGAVNTIHFVPSSAGGRPHVRGYNTDWSGFLTDLRALGINVTGRTCLILGGGGAARAVGYALTKERADVHFLVRRLSQGETIVTALRAAFPKQRLAAHPIMGAGAAAVDLEALAGSAALIVNATPVGLEPEAPASPWPADVPLPAGAWVYDLIYRPAETPLLHQARLAGCHTANGLGMLLHQAAGAFTIWTGRQPDLATMRQILEAAQAEATNG